MSNRKSSNHNYYISGFLWSLIKILLLIIATFIYDILGILPLIFIFVVFIIYIVLTLGRFIEVSDKNDRKVSIRPLVGSQLVWSLIMGLYLFDYISDFTYPSSVLGVNFTGLLPFY